jgi:carbamoyl-phosphate synthase large subunit
VPLDVVIPTLDAELPAFVDLAPTLAAWGVGTMLPTREQLDLRSKARLAALGEGRSRCRRRGC